MVTTVTVTYRWSTQGPTLRPASVVTSMYFRPFILSCNTYCTQFLVYEGLDPVKKSLRDVHIIPFLLRMRLFTESTWLF